MNANPAGADAGPVSTRPSSGAIEVAAPAASAPDLATKAAGALVERDFVAVYQERYAAMVRVAVLLLGDRAQAEEVVQDAFIAAYQRWTHVESPSAYVRQCVVNKSRDVLRRRRLTEAVLRRAHPTDGLGADGVPEHIEDLLGALTPRQRTAVVLRYYEDLGLSEIARLMHTRPGTVGSLLNRALARLREDVQL